MHKFNRSIALLRHPEQLENLWLACWIARRRHYDFVTAERLEGESFRECLDREIAWTLDIRRRQDYIISSVARLHLELLVDTAGENIVHVIEFYVVDLYGKSGRASVEQNQQLRWLTGKEALAGQTSEGVPINPLLVELLRKADVIAPHA